ncbi:MAG: hypothetical protein WHS88_05410 [Anaerohalosphaeraceae bacterium]
MTNGRGVGKGWAVLYLFIAFVAAASGGLKYVDAIDLDLGEFYFYNHSTQQFVLFTSLGGSEVPIDVGNIHIAGGGWDYSFVGKIIVTASDLFWKNTSGAKAQAIFTNGSSLGPATMTIIATELTDMTSGTVLFNSSSHPGGVVLLTAQMNDSDNMWLVSETGNYTDAFVGDTQYAITGGELKNGSLLRMLDFRAVWALGQCGPANISVFNQNLYSLLPSLELIPFGIPEPMSLGLLAVGALLTLKRK